MSSSLQYIKNDEIVFRKEEDGAFLFDPDTGNLKFVNHTGKRVFELLKEKKQVKQLVDDLLKEFPDIKTDQIKKDVNSFVKLLLKNEFIVNIK